MRVNILGKSKNKKITKTLLKEAVRYYCYLLKISKKVQRNLYLTIKFSDKLGYDTAATVENHCENGSKVFEICISTKEGFKPTLEALAHEMTHIEQWLSGSRYDYIRADGLVRWNKTIINNKKIDYWDEPWEVEAFGKQHGLYVRFIQHMKDKKKNAKS